MMIDIIIFTLYCLFTLTLIYLVIRLRLQNKKIMTLLIQSELDKALISKEVQRLMMENSNRELLESDGFIKFISDSRDWAFEYIEEVQKALAEFDEEVAPQLEWANTYGNLAGPTVHSNTIKIVSEAYDKLKTVLPKNTETPNN